MKLRLGELFKHPEGTPFLGEALTMADVNGWNGPRGVLQHLVAEQREIGNSLRQTGLLIEDDSMENGKQLAFVMDEVLFTTHAKVLTLKAKNLLELLRTEAGEKLGVKIIGRNSKAGRPYWDFVTEEL